MVSEKKIDMSRSKTRSCRLPSCQSSPSYTVLIINYHFLWTIWRLLCEEVRYQDTPYIHYSQKSNWTELNWGKMIVHLDLLAGAYARNDNYSFAWYEEELSPGQEKWTKSYFCYQHPVIVCAFTTVFNARDKTESFHYWVSPALSLWLSCLQAEW